MPRADHGARGPLGPTRIRDLALVAIIAGLAAYGLTRWNYSAIPQLPRLAGLTAALLGVGEAVAGYGLRARIRDRTRIGPDRAANRPVKPPVPPLVAARALAVAKASALAGAALAGLWVGFAVYVLPNVDVVAARADSTTAALGFGSALILTGGALYLEYCCRTPD